MTKTKTYLGDGVCAELIDKAGSIRLTVENGGDDGATQEIYVEPHVLRKLIKFAAVPVVKTCGACSWSNDAETCQHPCITRDRGGAGRPADVAGPRSLSSNPPPVWCPLRDEP